jgi:hypothetical protein
LGTCTYGVEAFYYTWLFIGSAAALFTFAMLLLSLYEDRLFPRPRNSVSDLTDGLEMNSEPLIPYAPPSVVQDSQDGGRTTMVRPTASKGETAQYNAATSVKTDEM